MFNLKNKVMKTAIGIGLIILGIISISRYPDLGSDFAETLGALFAVIVFLFLPAFLLIRSDNINAKTK